MKGPPFKSIMYLCTCKVFQRFRKKYVPKTLSFVNVSSNVCVMQAKQEFCFLQCKLKIFFFFEIQIKLFLNIAQLVKVNSSDYIPPSRPLAGGYHLRQGDKTQSMPKRWRPRTDADFPKKKKNVTNGFLVNFLLRPPVSMERASNCTRGAR